MESGRGQLLGVGVVNHFPMARLTNKKLRFRTVASNHEIKSVQYVKQNIYTTPYAICSNAYVMTDDVLVLLLKTINFRDLI